MTLTLIYVIEISFLGNFALNQIAICYIINTYVREEVQ